MLTMSPLEIELGDLSLLILAAEEELADARENVEREIARTVLDHDGSELAAARAHAAWLADELAQLAHARKTEPAGGSQRHNPSPAGLPGVIQHPSAPSSAFQPLPNPP